LADVQTANNLNFSQNTQKKGITFRRSLEFVGLAMIEDIIFQLKDIQNQTKNTNPEQKDGNANK